MFSILVTIWVILMLYASIIEYKYYQAVKLHEPDVWQQLGSPKYLNVPLVFVSPKGSKLIKTISNEVVRELAKKHRQTGVLFVAYVISVLIISIVYFKMV